jgi:hypothetical protein
MYDNETPLNKQGIKERRPELIAVTEGRSAGCIPSKIYHLSSILVRLKEIMKLTESWFLHTDCFDKAPEPLRQHLHRYVTVP